MVSISDLSSNVILSERPTSPPQPECPLCPPPHASPATVLSSLHVVVSETICFTYSFFACLFRQEFTLLETTNRVGLAHCWPPSPPSSEHCVQALCRYPAWVTVCPPRLARAEQAGWRGQGSPARLDSRRGGKTRRENPANKPCGWVGWGALAGPDARKWSLGQSGWPSGYRRSREGAPHSTAAFKH